MNEKTLAMTIRFATVCLLGIMATPLLFPTMAIGSSLADDFRSLRAGADSAHEVRSSGGASNWFDRDRAFQGRERALIRTHPRLVNLDAADQFLYSGVTADTEHCKDVDFRMADYYFSAYLQGTDVTADEPTWADENC